MYDTLINIEFQALQALDRNYTFLYHNAHTALDIVKTLSIISIYIDSLSLR